MSEEITVTFEQLESLLKDKEYAKEWKAMKYDEVLKENIKLKEEIKELIEQHEYWNEEYMRQDKKVEEYRKKYIKWKKKTKELRKLKRKNRKEDIRCYKCNKYGHYQKDCEEIKRKCNICGK